MPGNLEGGWLQRNNLPHTHNKCPPTEQVTATPTSPVSSPHLSFLLFFSPTSLCGIWSLNSPEYMRSHRMQRHGTVSMHVKGPSAPMQLQNERTCGDAVTVSSSPLRKGRVRGCPRYLIRVMSLDTTLSQSRILTAHATRRVSFLGYFRPVL